MYKKYKNTIIILIIIGFLLPIIFFIIFTYFTYLRSSRKAKKAQENAISVGKAICSSILQPGLTGNFIRSQLEQLTNSRDNIITGCGNLLNNV